MGGDQESGNEVLAGTAGLPVLFEGQAGEVGGFGRKRRVGNG